MIFFLLASICSLFSLVFALPVGSLVTRDDWVPQITSPNANTVWTAGCIFTVTWDASDPPSEITNPQGMIYLRINDETQPNPIAQGFPLTAGQVDVTVPADTQASPEWQVVRKSLLSLGPIRGNTLRFSSLVMGDSGNWSPPFTIQHPHHRYECSS